MRRLVAVACTLVALGSGCVLSGLGTLTQPSGMPTLRIERPVNGASTSEVSVVVSGRTDMSAIQVNGTSYPVVENTFDVPVMLLVGTNTITVATGNGFSTTTQSLRIERFNEP
ncbi:MAG: hypothetical protein V1745_04535 [Patescibacteria group bacterium]